MEARKKPAQVGSLNTTALGNRFKALQVKVAVLDIATSSAVGEIGRRTGVDVTGRIVETEQKQFAHNQRAQRLGQARFAHAPLNQHAETAAHRLTTVAMSHQYIRNLIFRKKFVDVFTVESDEIFT